MTPPDPTPDRPVVVRTAAGDVTPESAAEKARRLRAALLGAIGEQDMAAVTAAVVGKAKRGDLRAVDTLLKIIGVAGGEAAPSPANVVQVNVNDRGPAPGPRDLRRAVAELLTDRGPLRLAAIQKATGAEWAELQAVLAGPEFVAEVDGYDLTAAARVVVLEDVEGEGCQCHLS